MADNSNLGLAAVIFLSVNTASKQNILNNSLLIIEPLHDISTWHIYMAYLHGTSTWYRPKLNKCRVRAAELWISDEVLLQAHFTISTSNAGPISSDTKGLG